LGGSLRWPVRFSNRLTIRQRRATVRFQQQGGYIMSRLTQTIREKIVNKAVNAAFDPKIEAFKKQEAKLGIECYNAVFPKKVRDIISQVPEGWLRTCDCLRFNAGGWNVTLCVGKQMPTPASNHCQMLGNIDGELGEKVQVHSQEKRKLDEERYAAQKKLLGFLEGFNTFKQLREAWPEGEKFFKEFDAERVSPNVPAVVTKEINAMLGLKAKVAA
jgi:putative DNA base modification enzyme with NMAD domain